MADQKKVLISGDVHGKLSVLFKRVQAVNKANGPFDLLLCTGGFFPECGAHPLLLQRRKDAEPDKSEDVAVDSKVVGSNL